LKAAGDPGQSVLMMTWNIKFGGGRIDFFQDCFDDRSTMSSSEVHTNLDALIAKINQVNPDILFMQEVDIDSHRSGNINELKYILDRTGLNYGVYASQWRSEYIPSRGLGEMDSGNVILSRWPITDAYRIALPNRTDSIEIYRQFYLKRNMLTGNVAIPGHGSLALVNIHAEAYATDGTLERHIQKFKELIDGLNTNLVKFVAGGDFNDLPPYTAKLTDFPDQICTGSEFPRDDFTKGQPDLMMPLYSKYQSAIPLDSYRANNAPWFSFTADKNGFWNRTLDHLFTNGEFVPGSALMHQDTASGGMETMPLSDHAPLTVRLAL
jgi:endonuclease/exonuclease/phosphatase family metal-dependent hydrolase